MTINDIKNPPRDLVAAARTLLKAKAYTESVRPIVEAIQRRVLEKHQWRPAPPDGTEDGYDDAPITDPKQTYRLPDGAFETYLEEINTGYRTAGFEVELDRCPLLTAEHLERQARRALIETAAPLTGIRVGQILTKPKKCNRYVELLLEICSIHIEIEEAK